MSIEIRRLRPDDGERLRALRLAAISDLPEAFGSTYEETLERSAEEWTRRCSNASAGDTEALFFALDDGQPVALMGAYFEEEDDSWFLVSAYVDPRYRGTDLATRMHSTVVDWARAHGAEVMYLEVWRGNARAIGFYERLGYSFTGNSQPHPKYATETEVEMVLVLGQTG